MYFMAIRDIASASALLQSCIATFTCVEICTYNHFMFYALLTAIMTLPRNEMKKKIVDNPQVISVIKDVPNMQDLLHSIYDCDYSKFFQTVGILIVVCSSPFVFFSCKPPHPPPSLPPIPLSSSLVNPLPPLPPLPSP